MKTSKEIVKFLLDDTDIVINGKNPWDPQIHNEDFYNRVISEGSLGLGESYMDGWWDCKSLDQFFHKILLANLDQKIKGDFGILVKLMLNRILNPGRKSKAFVIGERHYDIGNKLYQLMLDKRLTYTCGYWKDAKNLEEAEEAKLDLICRKLRLKKGQTVLDIGSGWGSFLGFAAEKYKTKGVGITVSKEQKELSDELYKDLPIETRLHDYRETKGKFDHIVSVGMFEHVGYRNYRIYMETAHKVLKDDGLFLLHTIGGNYSGKENDLWIEKYIFPNSILPSIAQIGKSIEGLFVMEDWHNFGADYDKTLMAWEKNFVDNWDKIKSDYDERFYRMWRYYLLACAGSFRSRKNQLWQIVLSKNGVPGGYKSIR